MVLRPIRDALMMRWKALNGDFHGRRGNGFLTMRPPISCQCLIVQMHHLECLRLVLYSTSRRFNIKMSICGLTLTDPIRQEMSVARSAAFLLPRSMFSAKFVRSCYSPTPIFPHLCQLNNPDIQTHTATPILHSAQATTPGCLAKTGGGQQPTAMT